MQPATPPPLHAQHPDIVIRQIGVVETAMLRHAGPAGIHAAGPGMHDGEAQDESIKGEGLVFDARPGYTPGFIHLRGCVITLVGIGLLVGVGLWAGRHMLSHISSFLPHRKVVAQSLLTTSERPSSGRALTAIVKCVPERKPGTETMWGIPSTTQRLVAQMPAVALGLAEHLPLGAQRHLSDNGAVVDLFSLTHARIAIRYSIGYSGHPPVVQAVSVALNPPLGLCQAMQLAEVLPAATSFYVDPQGLVVPTTQPAPFFAHGNLRVKLRNDRIEVLQFQSAAVSRSMVHPALHQ